MASGISAGISWAALKIDYLKALSVWQFTPAELAQLEGPSALFLEKYGPMLDDYGVEIQFAGAVLPILTGKIFAILALKRAIEEKNSLPAPAAAAPKASVTAIRPEADTTRREPEPAPQINHDRPEHEEPSPGGLPSAFLHKNVDNSAELVAL